MTETAKQFIESKERLSIVLPINCKAILKEDLRDFLFSKQKEIDKRVEKYFDNKDELKARAWRELTEAKNKGDEVKWEAV